MVVVFGVVADKVMGDVAGDEFQLDVAPGVGVEARAEDAVAQAVKLKEQNDNKLRFNCLSNRLRPCFNTDARKNIQL